MNGEYLCIAQKKLEISCQRVLKSFILDGSWQERYKGLAWRKKYKICAVCAVGMGQTGTQRKEIREKNNIPGKIPVFTLQENFSVERLHGMYKMMMNIMVKTAGKTLEKKTDRTPEEEDMLDMMLHGGERVKIQNLQGVISWYNGKR